MTKDERKLLINTAVAARAAMMAFSEKAIDPSKKAQWKAVGKGLTRCLEPFRDELPPYDAAQDVDGVSAVTLEVSA